MDVLVRFMPAPLQFALRVAEQILLLVLAPASCSRNRTFMPDRCSASDRTHSAHQAGVPMGNPHGLVVFGFAMILLIIAWRLLTVVTRREPARSAPADGKVME